jgi:hypothetical protein
MSSCSNSRATFVSCAGAVQGVVTKNLGLECKGKVVSVQQPSQQASKVRAAWDARAACRVRPEQAGQVTITSFPLEGLLLISPLDRRAQEFEFDVVRGRPMTAPLPHNPYICGGDA